MRKFWRLADYGLAMLTMKAQYSLGNAEKYFKEHLQVGDYYMEGQQVMGQWMGQGAESLGLTGATHTDEFVRLCRNLHPETGEQLTPRLNGKRITVDGHVQANRRVFYDFTLSPPKSVSIAALIGNDQRIIDAHDKAVQSAFRQLEQYAAARIRKGGQTSYRMTGNVVAAVFRHDTSRALDPHLHSHCILFNATRDSVENRWKALEPYEMLVAKKFTEQVYYHELVQALTRFGYGIENKPRGDFEIAGISQELIERFSKRHREIDEKTRELLAREPDKVTQNLQEIRANIAHKERARKIKNVGIQRLQSLWNGQLSDKDRMELRELSRNFRGQSDTPRMSAREAVVWAEAHLFDRRSVVPEHELWRHALDRARGQNISLADIQAITRQRGYVRNERFPGKVTRQEVITREWNIVCLAQEGRGTYAPISSHALAKSPSLDAEQLRAVEHILSSRDFVTLFRGGAGTGKSYTLKEVQAALKRDNRAIQALAPQRQQVNDLERAGFTNAQTVSGFLARGSLPRGAVVLVDEAGQIGGEQMLRLLQLVKENDGRIILSGDTRQHGAVEATDALRAIEKYSGLRYAELTNIRRQDPESAKTEAERQWLEQYKLAVDEARQGRLAASFERLDKQKAIVSCTLADQHQKLTEDYLHLAETNHSTVVVSQSWAEIHKVNEQVRNGLKAKGLIGEKETAVTALDRLDLTDAQKRDKRHYDSNSVVVFNRDAAGFKAGDTGRLLAMTNRQLLIQGNNRTRPVPFQQLDKLTVCQPKELTLSTGDRLQLKANGQTRAGQKLANGELVTVREVRPNGTIALEDGRVLEKDYRQFVRGYAVTSYAAQGKTVDYVLFSDSAVKAATNEQQWYVTISRGRKGVKVYTADKYQLRENITRSGDRTLALDIAPRRETFAQRLATLWKRDVAFVVGVLRSQRKSAQRRVEASRQEVKTVEQSETVRPSRPVRQTPAIVHEHQPKQSHGRGMGI
ncbi:MAG TPA: MobF family relaxase [Candidatus Angelobacter sp.]|nr:MobF family relaxase [Candidatus Angelobacter sp.]